MNKLLFVFMLCLLSSMGCKAAEEPISARAQATYERFIAPALETAEVRFREVFPCAFAYHRAIVWQQVGLKSARGALMELVQAAVAPRSILQYARQRGGARRLKQLFDRNTQTAINIGLAAEEAGHAQFEAICNHVGAEFFHPLGGRCSREWTYFLK